MSALMYAARVPLAKEEQKAADPTYSGDECVRLLLESGAIVTAEDAFLCTALVHGLKSGEAS